MDKLQTTTWKVLYIPFELTPVDSNAVSRLIHAALVDCTFEHLLLTDPLTAMTNGYNGESFAFDEKEQAFILTIRADSLVDFANQWVTHKTKAFERNPQHT